MILSQTGRRLSAGENEWKQRLPQVEDISSQQGIRLEVELLQEGIVWLQVALIPLRIARPEFFPAAAGSVAVMGKGLHRVEIPLEQFDFRQMTRAFLKYLDGFSVKLLWGGPVVIGKVEADILGDFTVSATRASRAVEAGEWAEYSVMVSNRSGQKRMVNVGQSLYGKECLSADYEPCMVLDAWESREYTIKILMTEDIPPGGLERSSFLFVPEGEGAKAGRITLQTVRKRKHPYLYMTEEQWKRRKAVLTGAACSPEETGGQREAGGGQKAGEFSPQEQRRAFFRKYVEAAKSWEVPVVSEREDYVYPAYSQNDLFRTAAAWKITGAEAFREKAVRYLTGLLDRDRGYLAARKSYFSFIESREEYARGDFKVCSAQSAGWVQEAEFFIKTALSYDLLYDCFSPKQHSQMEACLRNYMEFVSWRLTDGDGNNFQVAESGAGLLCAMVLQDQEMVDRFIDGPNGFEDLLSAVFLDDGMYFEEASGYVRLVGELFFEIVNAAENYGISLKHRKVSASFDRNILHAPWAMRENWAEDGKPFLGMSFRRFESFSNPTRCLKDFFDCTAKLLTDRGILFSINDSNEQDFTGLYQKAYYLYGDVRYEKLARMCQAPDPLLVREETEVLGREAEAHSLLFPGAGLGVLREGSCQAVLKFGGHGGYHGHFDRLSLASFLQEGRTFHNNEYAWYGYDSFLFKMWVQTSMAHNMVVVDGRMQKPSPCECVYFAANEKAELPEESKGGGQEYFSAVCAQTTTVWMDPPYGGQTPYPFAFPEEKCAREGRYILPAGTKRGQGEIGEYSEPVFQRRLLVLFHGYCIVWDYLEGEQEHGFDCLYHPMGRLDPSSRQMFCEKGFEERKRFSEDPFGAGQFILNCRRVWVEGASCLRFRDGTSRVNGNDIVDFTPESALWRAWPRSGAVTVGRYPQRGDTFTEENRKAAEGYLEEPLKKTVSFSAEGKSAGFLTILEAGEKIGKIRDVDCVDFTSVTVTEDDGAVWEITAAGMDDSKGRVNVKVRKCMTEARRR